MAILAVLAAMAVPSFGPVIERWRVRDTTENLTTTLYYARSEGIKRGGNVIIRANSGTDWGSGWKVFFDQNGNGTQDCATVPNECDLQVYAVPVKTSINLSTAAGGIAVDRWGMQSYTGAAIPAPTNMAFEVFPKDKTAADATAARLCVGLGGRIVRKKGSETC